MTNTLMIYYTIYTSTPTDEISQKIVDEITNASARWNKDHGITGILLCMEDRYFQFLEGDEKYVVEIFDVIKEDKRHKEVTRRINGFSKERVFTDWSMGSWMLSNDDINNLTAVKDLSDHLKDPEKFNSQSKFVSMMKNILETWLVHEPERAERLKQRK